MLHLILDQEAKNSQLQLISLLLPLHQILTLGYGLYDGVFLSDFISQLRLILSHTINENNISLSNHSDCGGLKFSFLAGAHFDQG